MIKQQFTNWSLSNTSNKIFDFDTDKPTENMNLYAFYDGFKATDFIIVDEDTGEFVPKDEKATAIQTAKDTLQNIIEASSEFSDNTTNFMNGAINAINAASDSIKKISSIWGTNSGLLGTIYTIVAAVVLFVFGKYLIILLVRKLKSKKKRK